MSVQDKLQARIASLMKAKAAEDERHAAEKSRDQGPALEEVAKGHAEELRALEAKLIAKHQEELKSALEKAHQEKSTVKLSADQDIQTKQKATVDAAIAELQAKHAEEISAAVERGRMESAAKGKLKDSQLVKAQKRVKELEAQILSLTPTGSGSVAGSSAGPVAGPSTGPSASATPATASNPTQAVISSSAPNSSATSDASTATSAALPRKPSVANAPPTGPARGAARGAVRGRGVQRALGGAVSLGRGAPKLTDAPPAVGMQIMGAAAKRPLDDSSEDSLAKRLKPAEPATKPPVQIRRPPSGAPPQ